MFGIYEVRKKQGGDISGWGQGRESQKHQDFVLQILGDSEGLVWLIVHLRENCMEDGLGGGEESVETSEIVQVEYEEDFLLGNFRSWVQGVSSLR